MKNIFYTIIMSVILFTSCNEFLTIVPQDKLVSDNYYTSETALRANTASLYGRVWWDFHCQFMWLAGDQLAGDLYYTYDQEGHFFYNAVGAGNSFNNTGWIGLYRVVSYANSIINDMPEPAKYNNVDEAAIARAVAEARFIRATAYIYLAAYWGEVPIIENSTALITSSDPKDIYVNKHLQGDIYRFICEDLEYAAATLPNSDAAGRATAWSAKGMLARAYLMRAAFEKNEAYYGEAKKYAQDVIDNSGLSLYPDYSTLFDVSSNNNVESLFAIQCMKGNYADGSSRNVNWSRSKRIADQTWGAGKGPTRSLQSLYSSNDLRRKWIFMTNGDSYPNLATEEGGYTYQFSYRNPDDLEEQVESASPMLAHIKKYIIGKPADCGGNIGENQDAGNNIYILRLTDVYMMYIEACIGLSSSTSDAKAIQCLNSVLARAGLSWTEGSISFEQLLTERRKEFAFEGLNWLDIKRYYFRDPSAAIAYLNNMERDKIYVLNYNSTPPYGEMTTEDKYAFENNPSSYLDSWETLSDTEDHTSRVNNIVFTDASMYIPLPSAVTTKAPILLEPAVSYYDAPSK